MEEKYADFVEGYGPAEESETQPVGLFHHQAAKHRLAASEQYNRSALGVGHRQAADCKLVFGLCGLVKLELNLYASVAAFVLLAYRDHQDVVLLE